LLPGGKSLSNEIHVIPVIEHPPGDARSRDHAQNPTLSAVAFHVVFIFIHKRGMNQHPHEIGNYKKRKKQDENHEG